MFAGHDNLTPSTDPTPGICVMFAHRSLEEFFGSFGFLQDLDDGKSVEDILGSDCEKPIFMVNPLVFKFCMWLLSKDLFGCSRDVYNKLVTYAAQQIDSHIKFFTDRLFHVYPAINIANAVENKENLELEFLGRFSKNVNMFVPSVFGFIIGRPSIIHWRVF